ncbi:hypothetical protein BJ508DRAFT_313545 [Ascobolus immersus RN42]|uniref:Uncharacterized protein n=1 Tax=Ascobolus immersus RN42 TaxID=1160509 RepID=A0A3N4HLB1_ASCIM|nr:hypothetical protein BJ508DRAFT_313545 [Ascobolus immersus RN42]
MPSKAKRAAPPPASTPKTSTKSYQSRLERLERKRLVFRSRVATLQERGAAANDAFSRLIMATMGKPAVAPAVPYGPIPFIEPVTPRTIPAAEEQMDVLEVCYQENRARFLWFETFVDGFQAWHDMRNPTKFWESYRFAKVQGLYSGKEPGSETEMVNLLLELKCGLPPGDMASRDERLVEFTTLYKAVAFVGKQ